MDPFCYRAGSKRHLGPSLRSGSLVKWTHFTREPDLNDIWHPRAHARGRARGDKTRFVLEITATLPCFDPFFDPQNDPFLGHFLDHFFYRFCYVSVSKTTPFFVHFLVKKWSFLVSPLSLKSGIWVLSFNYRQCTSPHFWEFGFSLKRWVGLGWGIPGYPHRKWLKFGPRWPSKMTKKGSFLTHFWPIFDPFLFHQSGSKPDDYMKEGG